MSKYKVDDVIWTVNYIKHRVEVALVHEVYSDGTCSYGIYGFKRPESELFVTREEAEEHLQKYLKGMGG